MLSKIIKAFEQADGSMDLNELSQSLDVERSALQGMLELLVRQGKLREITPGSEICDNCSSRFGCTHLHAGSQGGKVYELPQRSL